MKMISNEKAKIGFNLNGNKMVSKNPLRNRLDLKK